MWIQFLIDSLTDSAGTADAASEWAKLGLSITGGATGLAIVVFLVRKLWVALTSGLEADYARMKRERDEVKADLARAELDRDAALTQRDEWHQKYDNLYWDHQRLKLQTELQPSPPPMKELTNNAEG